MSFYLVFLSLAGADWVSEGSECEVPIKARLSHAGEKADGVGERKDFHSHHLLSFDFHIFKERQPEETTPTIV